MALSDERYRARVLKAVEKIPLIERELAELKRELLGNGQPGRLQVLEEKVAGHEKLAGGVAGREKAVEELKGKVDGLERFRWMATGALGVLTLLIGWALAAAKFFKS